MPARMRHPRSGWNGPHLFSASGRTATPPHRLAGILPWYAAKYRSERIKPGQPQQNGRHERMHLTLKREPPTRPG